MTLKKPKVIWFAAFTAVFAVCAAFVFWGTWSPEMVPVMPDCPTSYSTYWFRDWLRAWLENGKFAPAQVINWIGSPYLWTEFQYAFAAYMSALGMVYFLRGRGLPRVAAYGAGLLLAFSGYWFTLFSAGHLGWFQWMTYGVFAFGLIDRALEKGKPRHWLLLGACLAWGSMHQPDLWLLFSAFSGIYFVFRLVVCLRAMQQSTSHSLVPHSPSPVPRSPLPVTIIKWTKGSLIALAALLAIGGASFRSAFVNDLAGRDKQIEEGQTVAANVAKDDAEKRWIFVTNWSMPPEATKEFWHAGIEGDTSCPMTLAIGQKRGNGIRQYTGALGRPLGAKQGNYRQHSLYVGWLTCLLALLGGGLALVAGFSPPSNNAGWPRASASTIIFFFASAVVFWLFSMGRYCEPVYRLVYALPFGDYLRAPVKWHHITEFCLCVLAGYGIWGWMYWVRAKWLSDRVKTAAVAVLVLLGVVDLVSNDRLYCAPHRADAEMQFVDGRMLQDPRGVAQLNQMRARVLGTYQGAALIEVPKKKPKDEPAPELPSPQPVTLALGILSLVGTLAVGAYGIKKS
ncbi:MAG: hypothetical protein K6G94_04115 [Kiritimatiellae bacterium]|nr:hypothetical protein [Kiritimatiellia bacterium]